MALAPRRLLFGVPSSSTSAASSGALVAGVETLERVGDLPLHVADRLPDALPAVHSSPPSRSSTASCSPVDAPEGPPRGPRRRIRDDLDLDRRVARESRICRAQTPRSCSSPPHLRTLARSYQRSCASRAAAPTSRRPPPPAAPASSTRRGTLRTVARSASSGSTFCCRATLTTVKSTSPISSNAGVGLPLGAARLGRSRRAAPRAPPRAPSKASDVRPVVAGRDHAPLHLAGEEKRRQRLRHVVEDPAAPSSSRLIASQRSRTRPAVRASASPKTCGCRRTSFSWIARATASRSPASRSSRSSDRK